MEGNIYLCEWKRSEGSSFNLVLSSNSSIFTEGDDLDVCKDSISEQILSWNGDGEAIIELIPPLDSTSEMGSVLYSAISYNETCNALNSKELFTDGNCTKCKFGIGKRTISLLNIDSKPTHPVVGVWRGFPNQCIYSNAFLKELSLEELSLIETKPVLVNGKTSDYSEIIPKGEFISGVGCKGSEYPSAFHQSWICDLCKRDSFITINPNYSTTGTMFISSESIKSSLPSMIVLYSKNYYLLAFKNDRWAELLKRVKGLLSDPVVVLNKNYAEIPELVETDEFDWV